MKLQSQVTKILFAAFAAASKREFKSLYNVFTNDERTDMKMKFAGPVAWGGSDDNETLKDVLEALRKAAKSVRWVMTKETSGGWPVYEFTCDAGDLEKVAAHWEIEVEDLGAIEA